MSVDLFEIKIPASEAQLGMHVIRLDRPWEETDFMLQGFVVKDQDEINALREQCQFIYVEGKSYKQYGQVADSSPWPGCHSYTDAPVRVYQQDRRQ